MIVIAHRGARAFSPENTLEAFVKAAETRADAVELDVQLSADGVAVVFHDDTLLRCSDAGQPVPRSVVLNSPPAAMLPPLTRSMFQSRLDAKASTFLPLTDNAELVRCSR